MLKRRGFFGALAAGIASAGTVAVTGKSEQLFAMANDCPTEVSYTPSYEIVAKTCTLECGRGEMFPLGQTISP